MGNPPHESDQVLMAIMHMLATPRPRHLLKLGDSSNNPTPLCRPQARGGPSTPPSAHWALSPPSASTRRSCERWTNSPDPGAPKTGLLGHGSGYR